MKAKFKIVKCSDCFEVVNQHGVKFSFSYEVGVPVAIGALVQKSLSNFTSANNPYDYEYELIITEKK